MSSIIERGSMSSEGGRRAAGSSSQSTTLRVPLYQAIYAPFDQSFSSFARRRSSVDLKTPPKRPMPHTFRWSFGLSHPQFPSLFLFPFPNSKRQEMDVRKRRTSLDCLPKVRTDVPGFSTQLRSSSSTWSLGVVERNSATLNRLDIRLPMARE